MKLEIKKLLDVLDLPEDSPEQYGWLLSMIREYGACCPADLAFRLRDEAVKISEYYWHEGKYEVAKIKHYKSGFTADSHPIDWIIAALIARILAKEKDEMVVSEILRKGKE